MKLDGEFDFCAERVLSALANDSDIQKTFIHVQDADDVNLNNVDFKITNLDLWL